MGARSSNTKKTKRRTRFGLALEQSAKEILAHVRGDVRLPTRRIVLPDEVDVKRIQNPAGWDGEIVETLADGGIRNGHGRGLARQSAEPDQFVATDLH